jgi:hypothetical protein
MHVDRNHHHHHHLLHPNMNPLVPELVDVDLAPPPVALTPQDRRIASIAGKVAFGVVFLGSGTLLAAAVLTASCESKRCKLAAEVLGLSGCAIFAVAGISCCLFRC